MRKKFVIVVTLFTLFFIGLSPNIRAWFVLHSFDEIKIESAYKFEVLISQMPDENSFLYDKVELNDVLTVYVGYLESKIESNLVEQNQIIIVSDSSGKDILSWMMFHTQTNDQSHVIFDFGSEVPMNPNVGINQLYTETGIVMTIKNISVGFYQLIDNTGTSYEQIEDSYRYLPNLNLSISAVLEEE